MNSVYPTQTIKLGLLDENPTSTNLGNNRGFIIKKYCVPINSFGKLKVESRELMLKADLHR